MHRQGVRGGLAGDHGIPVVVGEHHLFLADAPRVRREVHHGLVTQRVGELGRGGHWNGNHAPGLAERNGLPRPVRNAGNLVPGHHAHEEALARRALALERHLVHDHRLLCREVEPHVELVPHEADPPCVRLAQDLPQGAVAPAEHLLADVLAGQLGRKHHVRLAADNVSKLNGGPPEPAGIVHPVALQKRKRLLPLQSRRSKLLDTGNIADARQGVDLLDGSRGAEQQQKRKRGKHSESMTRGPPLPIEEERVGPHRSRARSSGERPPSSLSVTIGECSKATL